MAEYVVVLVTVGSRKEGEAMARALVEEKLAACVNILGPVTSIFSWKEKLCKEREALLVIKTRRALFKTLATLIKAMHSYEVPEIIALPIEEGWPQYLRWIAEETNMKN